MESEGYIPVDLMESEGYIPVDLMVSEGYIPVDLMEREGYIPVDLMERTTSWRDLSTSMSVLYSQWGTFLLTLWRGWDTSPWTNLWRR